MESLFNKVACLKNFFTEHLRTSSSGITTQIQVKGYDYRSSRPEVSCKKHVLKNFTKFTGKHLCQSLFFNNGFHEIFKNNFSYRTPLVAACVTRSLNTHLNTAILSHPHDKSFCSGISILTFFTIVKNLENGFLNLENEKQERIFKFANNHY